MSFRESDVLWLLALVPVLAALPVFAWWMRGRAAARFGNPETTAMLVAGRSGPWRATRAVLFVSAITLTVGALAGPQWGSRTRVLRKRGIDVVVVLDFSKSMLARDVRPSRIERAKAEVVRFIQELDGDRVGVVAFAGETMEFPMTTDYAALELFFRDLGPYDMPVGGTAIGRALTSAQHLLERAAPRGGADRAAPEQARSRVVILMTDGEDHEGDPVAVARELAEQGVRVYTIGIGSRTGEPIPTYAPDGTWTGYLRDDDGELVQTSLTEENEQQLREIAEATGGRYFPAERGGVGISQIRAEMRRMHQDEQRTRRIVVHEDRYALLLFPAFLLIVLEGLLPDAWIGRWRRRARGTGGSGR
ncbi:MAG: VWA domain-containing protein [Myxococcota bacterium]|nr:VWA domain-containing protein [Myxococcota bacterium]